MYLLYIVLKKRVEFLHSVVTVVCFNKTLQVPIMQNVDVCMSVHSTYYLPTTYKLLVVICLEVH